MAAASASTIESSECIVTLAKVLDNILTEKEYTKKTRKLKVSNPIFDKRVVRHVGGVQFLKECGFTQRKDVLELTQEAEDKGKLWLARRALHEHAASRKVKLPSMCRNPNDEPVVTAMASEIQTSPVPTDTLLESPVVNTPIHFPEENMVVSLVQIPVPNTAEVPAAPRRPPQSPKEPALDSTQIYPNRECSSSYTSHSIGTSMFTDDLDSEIMQALMDEEFEVSSVTSASKQTMPPMEIVTNQQVIKVSDNDECSIFSNESSVLSSRPEIDAFEIRDDTRTTPTLHFIVRDNMTPSPNMHDGLDQWGDALQPPSTILDPLQGLGTPSSPSGSDAIELTSNDYVLAETDRSSNIARLQRVTMLEQEMAEALGESSTSLFTIPDQPYVSETECTPVPGNTNSVNVPHERLPLPLIDSIDDLNAYFDDQSNHAPKYSAFNTTESDLEIEMTRLLAEASELRGRTLLRSSSWTDATDDPSNRESSPSLRTATNDCSLLPADFRYSSFHAHKDWSKLDKVMHQASLQSEYESCWGSLCTLSVVCADLSTEDLGLPNLLNSNSTLRKISNCKQSWLPLELVQGLWKLVLANEEKLNPLRIDDVCLTLYDVLVKSEFLEVYERGAEDQDLPHPSWVRVKMEKMVLLGFALPISIEKQNVWMKDLSKVIAEDIQFWYGRYALPTIALAGGDDGTIAKSLLTSLEFIQTRLDVIGLATGTRRHMQDCRAYVKAQRDVLCDSKSISDQQEPGRMTELCYDVALDACQQVVACLYRTGQLLGKIRGSEVKKQELCSALHIVGMSSGEWGDYYFEIKIYQRAMKIQMDYDGTASVASADLLLSMGACNLGLGETNSAMRCYEEAKRIFEGRLGKKHDKVAQVLHLMGVIHCERSEQNVAMECFKISLKIRQNNGMLNDYDAAMADTLCWIGRVYREQGFSEKAKKYFEVARDAREELFGTDSLEFAEVLHNIAVIYDDAEDFEKSLSYYRKSLKIRRAVLGEEHEDVFELITCIGNVYRSMGDNNTALKAFRRALNLRLSVAQSMKLSKSQTEALIYSHEDVLELLNQQVSISPDPDSIREEISSVLLKMGHLYDTISRFDKSLKYLEKALKIRQNVGDGIKIAQVLNVIGIAFAKRRKFSEAKDAFEQSLALRKETLGEWNNDVAETLHNMGNCAAKKGDFDDAKAYYEESLRIKRKNLGNENVSVAQTLHNLGNIMAEKGSTEAAMQYYQEALSIRLDTVGMDHLDVAYSLHCIAKIHKKKHNIKASQEFFNGSLRIKRLNLRKNHPSIAETLEQLGLLYAEIGTEDEAVACLKGALSIFKSRKAASTKVAEVYEALGNMYDRNGDESNALNNFCKALRVQIQVFGEENLKVADMYYKVGLLQKTMKLTHEALLSFQAATRARKKVSGRNDIVIADILCEAGQLQMQVMQVEVAEKCFNEALRIRRQLLEDGHEKIGEVLLYVGDVYFANGFYENAIESVIEGLDIFKLNGSGQGMLAAGACQRLGAAHKASGSLDEAVAFYSQCLDIRSALAGHQSLLVAEINHELGVVHFARGDFTKAEELFRESVEVKVNLLGEDSLEAASTVLLLGRVCLKMNSPDEATMYFEQARLIKQLHLGDTHIECLEISRDIGHAHEVKGEFEESLSCYNSYLRTRRSAADDDEVVGDLLYSIGDLEHKLKRQDDALKSFASALVLYRALLGNDHTSVAKTLFGLGRVYEAKWEYKESMKYHKEAFRLRRRLLGSEDISVAESLDKISWLYMKQPNLEKALQSMKEALRIRTLVLGKDNLEVATSLYGMGVIFNDLGDTEKAMECYTVALDIRKGKLGDGSLEVAQTLHNIGTVYAKDREYSNALSHWRQALVAYREAGFADDNHLVAITIGNINMAESYQEEQAKLHATWN